MPHGFHRIVTGHDVQGKSIVVIDGPPAAGIGEMWLTDNAPADNSAPGDTAKRPRKLEPPLCGSIFRYFMVEPEDPSISREEREGLTAQRFAEMGAAHCRVDTSRHPAMHKTRTVDYIILLSGEVTLLLDKGEVDLKPFDVVVQRGTNHAWVNKGTEPALLAAILIDATEG
jgi:mannose-6-phosphate isomerase-like protein (cupin superfamily)